MVSGLLLGQSFIHTIWVVIIDVRIGSGLGG
jgi:hypothetical protein